MLACRQTFLKGKGLHELETKSFWTNTVFVIDAAAAKEQNETATQLSAIVGRLGFEHLTKLEVHTNVRTTPVVVHITFRPKASATMTFEGNGLNTSSVIRFRLALVQRQLDVAERIFKKHTYLHKTLERLVVYMGSATIHLESLERNRVGNLLSAREGAPALLWASGRRQSQGDGSVEEGRV